MKVLTVNTTDKAGGAERIAYQLFTGVRNRGHESKLIVGRKTISDDSIFKLDNNNYRSQWARIWRTYQNQCEESSQIGRARISGWLANIGEVRRWISWQQGYEDNCFPGSRHLFELAKFKPDIVHFHNLHGGYFDLSTLPYYSNQTPVFYTLHDEWSYTGHCAYSINCNKWEHGCGLCPDLDLYPALKRDGTRYNWHFKKKIFERSKIYLSTPSQWLMDNVNKSIINNAIVESRVIPYGIDLTIFRPGCKEQVRHELGLQQDQLIVLFLANMAQKSGYKDFATIISSIKEIASKNNQLDIHFICVGHSGADEMIGCTKISYVKYLAEPEKVAMYYQASDIFLHAAKADNYPLTIIEALACGLPVVATSVGGVSEMVDSGNTGYLVPQEGVAEMAEQVTKLIRNDELRGRMSDNASSMAHSKYDVEAYVTKYLNWYSSVVSNHVLS